MKASAGLQTTSRMTESWALPFLQEGMGIENRFLFRTGAESTNSLESLASLLNDSAYRFRWRQMRHDVTHTLLCFGSDRGKHGAAEEEAR